MAGGRRGGRGAAASPAAALAGTAPVFTQDSPPLDVCQAGSTSSTTSTPGFDYLFAASGSPSPTFTASGLPAGVSIDPATGFLTGAFLTSFTER